MTDATQIDEGDYMVSETGVYEISEIDESRTEKPFHVEIASEREEHAEAQQSNAGWGSTTLVECMAHVPREDVESVSITDGDTIRWETAHEDGSSEEVTVVINDDGSVTLQADGLFVPESFPDVLSLKCNAMPCLNP